MIYSCGGDKIMHITFNIKKKNFKIMWLVST